MKKTIKKQYSTPRILVCGFVPPVILSGSAEFDTGGSNEGDADSGRAKVGGDTLWDYAEDED